MDVKDNPCWGCVKRKPYCHGRCKEHADWKAEKEAENQARRRVQAGYGPWVDYSIQHIKASYKAKRQK